MGGPKPVKPDKPEPAPAPVTPESADVLAAGEAERKRLQQEAGRNTTYRVNPIMGGQFTNALKKRTGD